MFEETVRLCHNPKKTSNWLMVETMRLCKEQGIEPDEIRFSTKHLASLIGLVEQKVINGTVAKEVFERIFKEDVDPVTYIEKQGLKTEVAGEELEAAAQRVMEENPQSVTDYQNGKKKAIGFLVGQMMKETRGKADPEQIRQILSRLLENMLS